MTRFLKRLFRPVVVVQTYKVSQTDYEKRRLELHQQLARELGRECPVKGWSGMNWIIVPVEIRPGTTARVQIPPDLTKQEAEKVARVVMAYGEPG